MASKAASGTRTSSRTKTTSATPAPPTTRTTRARTAAKVATPPAEPLAPPTKKAAVRKPPFSKDNPIDAPQPPAKLGAKATSARKLGKQPSAVQDRDREPITAYLRIRPRLGDEELSCSPYLTPLSDTTVNMTNPQDPQDNRTKYRFSTVPPSSTYAFSHVFLPNTTQSDFFQRTTLPLVHDVLTGQSGLLFTYGVTNSGKTYTVQGGTQKGAAGILPRSLDVIFNSIEGLHGDGRYRPVRLHGIELSDDYDCAQAPTMPESTVTEVLGSLEDLTDPEFEVDPTTIKVDRNYEYTVWISYAEVYNEKIYDLLASVKDESAMNIDGPVARAGGRKQLLLTRQALPLRPSPASDSMDSESSGKYIAGLRQFRVHSASEAKALVKLGQLHRRVFGTLANRESSRSHGMVIVKVVRGHRGDRGDPTSLQISRLTLVDLAGSERTKHTHTTGDRLKEAGNINKSLMVLGQCMEVMRSNQRKIATSLSQDASKDNRIDTRDVKKGLAVVPFRHSKLTEALMDYFTGDGRTVMIVNVNPYDTGYDENSHVMKFAALAREVYVNPVPAPVQRLPTIPGKTHGAKIKHLGPMSLRDPEIVPLPYSRRKVTISIGGHEHGKKMTEAVLEVREEDEPADEQNKDQEDDDDPVNPLVNTLFDEIESLRYQLFECEMRCATIEAETREEVMQEMEERMRAVEKMYSRRLMNELEQNEIKTNKKIDMLHQSGLFGSPVKKQNRMTVPEEPEEEDVEMSLIDYVPDDESQYDERSISLSPLAKKPKPKPTSKSRKSGVPPQPIIEKRRFVPDPPMLPSDTEDAELTESDAEDEVSSIAPSGTSEHDDDVEEDEDEDEDEDENYSETEDEGDYKGPYESSKPPKGKKRLSPSAGPSPQPKKVPSKGSRLSKLAQDVNNMKIQGNRNCRSLVNSTKSSNSNNSDVDVEKAKVRRFGK